MHFHVAQLIRTDETVFNTVKHFESLDDFKTRQFSSAMHSDAFFRNDLCKSHNFFQYSGTEIVDVLSISFLHGSDFTLLRMLHRDIPYTLRSPTNVHRRICTLFVQSSASISPAVRLVLNPICCGCLLLLTALISITNLPIMDQHTLTTCESCDLDNKQHTHNTQQHNNTKKNPKEEAKMKKSRKMMKKKEK